MNLNFTKFLLSLVAFTLFSVGAQAQTTVSDSIVLQPGYTQQAYYSVVTGNKTYAPLAEWDLAFKVDQTFTAAIWANEATRLAVYHVPGANFSDVLDTANMASWTEMDNSLNTWEVGALNANADSTDQFDFGWGQYTLATHTVNGSEVYVLAFPDTTFKKITINSLVGGGNVYHFQYADLDGGNAVTDSLDKTDYPNKLFAYYDLQTSTEMDREPAADSWELLFSTKQTPTVIPGFGVSYSAGTVYANEGTGIATVTGVDAANYDNYMSQAYDSSLLVIGESYRERVSNPPPGFWQVADSTVYFVQGNDGYTYKLVFTDFEGQGTGKIKFNKTSYQAATGITENSLINNVSVFPNPVNNEASLSITSQEPATLDVFVSDLSGKAMYQAQVNTVAGSNNFPLNVNTLSNGIYLIYITDGNNVYTQKLIKQ